MYAGTNYGQVMNHPIMAYQMNSFPSSQSLFRPSLNGMGFSQTGVGGVGVFTAALAPAIAGSGPAAPFVAVALILAPFLIKLFATMAKGCGESCVLTSDAANEVEKVLKQNLAMYQASGHTRAEQRAALDNFDLVWNQLVQFCGQPQFQTTKAGRNCVEDRKAGACVWRDSSGQCWNWFSGYRDPIANDLGVKPDAPVPAHITNAVEQAGQSILSGFSGSSDMTVPLLIIAALGVAWMVSK